MSSTISDLYSELQRFSHLQQLHSVLSKDLRSCRDRVLKETTSVRRELTFYRWCMRRDLNEPYPFPLPQGGGGYIKKSMDYDRLLFYRKLICYLHCHPHEFSKIIVSLPTIKNKPQINSLQSLYFDNEIHLAECIAFDIMLTDINSLTLLLRSILLHSQNFNTLTQKLFQLFIVITCHKLLNTTFRQLLNRLYKINEPLSFQKIKGSKSEILESSLYKSCDDVLSIIIEVLRILPVPLRQCVSVLKERLNNSPSSLLEWLLSTIFSPLLLQPDDWYLVICNPAHDEVTNNNNIQSIVTTLLQLCRTYQLHENDTDDTQTQQTQNETPTDDTNEVELMDLLLEKHGKTLTKLLSSVLQEAEPSIVPSDVLVPSNATPELFIWHKIFLKMIDSDLISNDLRSLCLSVTPPKNIPNRPWITIQLPTIDFKMKQEVPNGDGDDNEHKTSGNDEDNTGIGERMINIGSDDFTKQPKSKYLSEYIFKPIRVFLLSLTEAQSRAVPLEILINEQFKSPLINLNTQQITLLHEARSRIKEDEKIYNNIQEILNKVVDEYTNEFCNNLQEALSTHNVLSSLNYIQNKETILKELRIIAIETHENLQMRDILSLSKRNVSILRQQIERITATINEQQIQQINNEQLPNGNINSIQDGSDWLNDKFVVFRTNKCISKTRNALIRFLNDYGIGKVDFKRKFGGSVLDFTNKRISSILVNAIIYEIKGSFWNRCPIEDGKFKFQIIELNSKFKTLKDFMLGFLNISIEEYEQNPNKLKLPKLSQETISMMITKFKKINSEIDTIGDFEDCVATVREGLVASINGADSASGDDYMPLFCYIIMKGIPSYLPSQLQTCKIISQRKQQDKYFIDCCVAMKALRNFCNVLFKTENEKNLDFIEQQQQQQQPLPVGTITPQQPPQQQQQSPPVSSESSIDIQINNKKTTPSSLFNTLRSKLPQRASKSNRDASPANGSSASPGAPSLTNTAKKNFFNLSPTSSFSSFMKRKDGSSPAVSDNDEEAQDKEYNNNNNNNVGAPPQISKTLQVPQQMAPKPVVDNIVKEKIESVNAGDNVQENNNDNIQNDDNVNVEEEDVGDQEEEEEEQEEVEDNTAADNNGNNDEDDIMIQVSTKLN